MMIVGVSDGSNITFASEFRFFFYPIVSIVGNRVYVGGSQGSFLPGSDLIIKITHHLKSDDFFALRIFFNLHHLKKNQRKSYRTVIFPLEIDLLSQT